MGKLVKASYDAEHNTLRLVEPLEGVREGEEVNVLVTRQYDPERPWLAFSGAMSNDDADDLQHAIDEMFPPWK